VLSRLCFLASDRAKDVSARCGHTPPDRAVQNGVPATSVSVVSIHNPGLLSFTRLLTFLETLTAQKGVQTTSAGWTFHLVRSRL